jgi:hypothetical protein
MHRETYLSFPFINTVNDRIALRIRKIKGWLRECFGLFRFVFFVILGFWQEPLGNFRFKSIIKKKSPFLYFFFSWSHIVGCWFIKLSWVDSNFLLRRYSVLFFFFFDIRVLGLELYNLFFLFFFFQVLLISYLG